MVKIFSLILSLFISYHPSSNFICDGSILKVDIRNNLNGNFELTQDLENIDKGAFVVINWRDQNLMLPITFNIGEITFSDKKWLWSYQNNKNGLIAENPRLAQSLPNGQVKEYSCSAKVT